MNDNVINLLWLYPDLLDLHGDRGNVMAFERIAKMLGMKLNAIKIENLTDKFELENVDIILFNPGELNVILNIVKALERRKEEFVKFVEDEKYILAIGTSGAILGKDIFTQDEKNYKGLGILDMECRQRKTVIGDDIYFVINNTLDIIGSQIQMLDFIIDDTEALGEISYGYGNCGSKTEGCRNKNAIFTNALGPVFVKNPWWTEKILNDIANKKGFKTRQIPLDEFEIEIKSFNSTKKFIEGKGGDR